MYLATVIFPPNAAVAGGECRNCLTVISSHVVILEQKAKDLSASAK